MNSKKRASDRAKEGLVLQELCREAMHVLGLARHVALGVEVGVEVITRADMAVQLHAANFHNAMA